MRSAFSVLAVAALVACTTAAVALRGDRVEQAVLASTEQTSSRQTALWTTPTFCGMNPTQTVADKIRELTGTYIKGKLRYIGQENAKSASKWVDKWIAGTNQEPALLKIRVGANDMEVVLGENALHATLCLGTGGFFGCDIFASANSIQTLPAVAAAPQGDRLAIAQRLLAQLDSDSKLAAWYQAGMDALSMQGDDQSNLRPVFDSVGAMGAFAAINVRDLTNLRVEMGGSSSKPALAWTADKRSYQNAAGNGVVSQVIHLSLMRVTVGGAAAITGDLTAALQGYFKGQNKALKFDSVSCSTRGNQQRPEIKTFE